MRNIAGSLVIALLVALLVGIGSGVFIQASRSRAALAAVPPSPVVLSATYQPEKKQVVFEVYNPGFLPLLLVDQSVVFTPGPESKEKAYALAAVPLNLTLPAQGTVRVTLALKPESEELKAGDVVAGTIAYTHPLSPDVYAVTHLFKYGEEKK